MLQFFCVCVSCCFGFYCLKPQAIIKNLQVQIILHQKQAQTEGERRDNLLEVHIIAYKIAKRCIKFFFQEKIHIELPVGLFRQ